MTRALLLLLGLLMFASPALAEDAGESTVMQDGSTTPGPTASGGSCNWDEFKQSMKNTESCGGKPQIVNCIGYAGLYQFGEGALATIGWYEENGSPTVDGDNDFEGAWTGKAFGLGTATPTTKKCGDCGNPNGSGELVSPTLQAFLNNPAAQEQAFAEWMDYNYKATKHCQDKIGQEVTGYKLVKGVKTTQTCKVTLSGILAGAHIGGAGGICSTLNGGADKDDSGGKGNGTSRLSYVCQHGGFATPYEGGTTAVQACGQTSPGGSTGQVGSGAMSAADPEEAHNTPLAHYELLSDMIDRLWIGGLGLMAEQMTATMMHQAEIVGTFFDAKHQLETQRLFQQKSAQAHKDYQPSEQMCTFGTFARNLANTDRRMEFSQRALSQRGIQRDLMAGDTVTAQGGLSDQLSRFNTFREKFCDPKDNAGGNKDLCVGTPDPAMVNRDIDFTTTVDMPLTLQFDTLDSDTTDDETALFALMDNLFQNKPPLTIPKEVTTLESFVVPYQDLRALAAMRAVARNSFDSIIAQKALGPKIEGEESNAPYLRAFMKEMGITDEDEITRMIGERPSYWAQMEILTKKIYQNPGFFVNLYDKPANVTRMRAAMQAIKVMQDRDIYDALVRREMLISILSELAVRQQQERVDNFVRRLNASQ